MSINKYNPFDGFPSNFTCADFSSLIDRFADGFKIITGYRFETRGFKFIHDPFDIDISIFEGNLRIKE